ncbi:hypothetical protein [Halorientalis marina]|uniref:hypothetical protein n=1 Tax=Halorientalis marina TaxID=2931976 RepID=UPI001FF206A7|nr:hypothetical protein [Halorientalis marina]
MVDGFPTVPDQRLGGDWRLCARTEETLFRTPTAAVVGRTLVYEDAALADALAAAGTADALARAAETADGGDRLVDTGDGDYWRFFFATALSFRPALAPGIGPASMLPTVRSEALSAFTDDLTARGFEGVDRGRSQRVRTEGGDRARLTKLTARLPLGGEAPTESLDVEGWLAVWTTGGEFRIAGGAYPVQGLGDLLAAAPADDRPPTGRAAARDELLGLVRAVA